MDQKRWIGVVLAASLAAMPGCLGRGAAFQAAPAASAGPAPIENPFFTSIVDREYLWNQLVDTLDDYFKIRSEERVRLIGDILTEGRIETNPVVGATYFEPWRRDSAPGYERLYSTLQTVRRWARARVTPTGGGYLVEVAVFKELEDLERPEHSTVGGAVMRYDGTIDRGSPTSVGGAVSLGWIPQGRDLALEQQILAQLQSRLSGPPPRRPLGAVAPGTLGR